MNDWQIFSASAMGVDHQTTGNNSQDANMSFSSQDALVGFLADGCSKAIYSETYSRLAVDYLVRRTHTLLPQVSLDDLPHYLFLDLLGYLNRSLANQGFHDEEQKQRFISDHCLFTVMGLIITQDRGMILTCGDGIVMIDDSSIYIDQDNAPHYIAYRLQPAIMARYKDHIPTSFTLWEFDPKVVSSLTIASDAFLDNEHLLEQLPLVVKTGNSLKLALNRWTSIQQLLHDDASVVFAKKTPKEAPNATSGLS